MANIDQNHSYDIQGARGSETQATDLPGITPNSSTERLAQTIIDQYSGEIVRAALEAKPAVKNSVQVSPKVVASVIFAEQTSVGPFEAHMDLMSSLAGNDKTSVGVMQIQIRRAVEIMEPERDLIKKPLSDAEVREWYGKLNNPSTNIVIGAKHLQDNIDYYSRKEGKTGENKILLAIAKHRSGQVLIGRAQEVAIQLGKDPNKWDDVASVLQGTSEDGRNVVNFVQCAKSWMEWYDTRGPGKAFKGTCLPKDGRQD
jgi:hypothetical protein